MSHIWTFSPESEPLLQRCLSLAAPPDNNNKWVLQFGIRSSDLMPTTTGNIVSDDSPSYEDIPATQEHQNVKNSTVMEEMLDPEFDIKSNFLELVIICLRDPTFLIKLAETLPTNTVDIFVSHVFDTNDLNTDFLKLFFDKFTHTYIKRDNSRFSSNMLRKTYEIYPQYLKYTLKAIFKDLEIENNVVIDFVSSLTPKDQSEFLNMVSNIELSSIEFAHNILSIHTAYKTCNKTDINQNFLLSCLKNHCNYCINDKRYGKLLMAFLQHEKYLKRNIMSNICEELVDIHKTPFRKPCLNILKEIKDFK